MYKPCTTYPVSYTHLDVYKRQALGVAAPVVRWKYAYALKKLRKRCAQDERV